MLAWTQPALAALLCPSCYGFERLSGDVFVDRDMPEHQRAQFARTVVEGRRTATLFYGQMNEAPTILACATDACSRRVGSRGAPAVTYAHVGLRLSPSGLDPTLIAHELSHIELHGRIGLRRFLAGAIPAWFDEGLAVVVSSDPRYLEAAADGECHAGLEADLPSSMRGWMHRASTDRELYGRAACHVRRWMAANGGASAALLLIEGIRDGQPFEKLYGDALLGELRD